jgi:hypothetical protein
MHDDHHVTVPLSTASDRRHTANQHQVDAPPPPPTDNHHHHDEHHHHHHIIHTPPPPDDPPPSYDDATASATAPLLLGAPPGYGTTFPDQSSIASSDLDESDRSLPEWIGQALVVCVFVSITYGFWRIINAPNKSNGFPG